MSNQNPPVVMYGAGVSAGNPDEWRRMLDEMRRRFPDASGTSVTLATQEDIQALSNRLGELERTVLLLASAIEKLTRFVTQGAVAKSKKRRPRSKSK